MNLYQIDNQIERILIECTDTETGEFDTEKYAKLMAELEEAKETKIENIALYIKNMTAEAAAIREEEKNLASRRRARENKVESLKKYLTDYLEGKKFETARAKISFRTSKVLDIEDENKVANSIQRMFVNDEDFLTYQPPKIKKTELKTYLLSHTDITVDGAEVRENRTVMIK